MSSGDNSNILAARVVRETFAVDNVVARIYDPGRAEVYERLGIPTVATVRWTADQVLRRLLPAGLRAAVARPVGPVRIIEVHVDRVLGRPHGPRHRGRDRCPGAVPVPDGLGAGAQGRDASSRTATWSTPPSRTQASARVEDVLAAAPQGE